MRKAASPKWIRIGGIEFYGLHRNGLSLWPTSELSANPIHGGLVRMVADQSVHGVAPTRRPPAAVLRGSPGKQYGLGFLACGNGNVAQGATQERI